LNTFSSVEQLEEALSKPPGYLIQALESLSGDLMILGAGGKMGPTLCRMARRAFNSSGHKGKVIAVSRFSKPAEAEKLQACGVETIACDLMNPENIARLPQAENIVFMVGQKFGTSGAEATTWAVNSWLPGQVGSHFTQSRFMVFSTGNIYGLVPTGSDGSLETDTPNPQGEYAMSALGRERVFEYISRTHKQPVSVIRLNYACEMRYGVLVDLARRVWQGEPVDLSMGYFNIIWQGDANAMSLAALAHAGSPPFILNVTGERILRVREVAERFGRLLDRRPEFTGKEKPDALLSNARKAFNLFGTPEVTGDQLIEWVAEWIRSGGEWLGKPTHFESRDGAF
jgi:nucleoside-diphosphate-sugar epimerase